jgi:inosine-uridine nucleoside N-ribohydrolase
MENRKFIIDTDIGDDIDDAFAIYLAMKRKVDLIGVTTVYQNTDERSRMAKKLFKCFGRGYENVPVYTGYGQTLENSIKKFRHIVQYTPELERPEYIPDEEEPERAIDFLVESAKKYGEDLTIVAIGPFTNIARAIQKQPNVFEKCKVVIMGGAYFRQFADWNVTCDTIAADIVFKNIPQLECMGADVTHALEIGQENAAKILNYQGEDLAVKYIQELFIIWRERNGGASPWLHDPLAVYYAIDPTICEMKDASIVVITDGYAKGLTLNVDTYRKAGSNPAYNGFNRSQKAKVAFAVQKEKMIELFMNTILE